MLLFKHNQTQRAEVVKPGKHVALKMLWAQALVGSNPTFGTRRQIAPSINSGQANGKKQGVEPRREKPLSITTTKNPLKRVFWIPQIKHLLNRGSWISFEGLLVWTLTTGIPNLPFVFYLHHFAVTMNTVMFSLFLCLCFGTFSFFMAPWFERRHCFSRHIIGRFLVSITDLSFISPLSTDTYQNSVFLLSLRLVLR